MVGGLPTLLVELDDGTGTFPHNATTFVDLRAGWSLTRGRGDNFESINPSTLSLTLNNTWGHFTLGSPVFDIAVDQMIRVTESIGGTTSRRFTGYVQNWPTSWASPTATYAATTITAVDRLARLERRNLRSMVEEEILLDHPAAYFRLTEPAGSTSAGDASGNLCTPLTIAGSGAPLAFGSESGPATDSLTAAQFAGGQYLFGWVSVPVPFTLEMFLARVGLPAVGVGDGLIELGPIASSPISIYLNLAGEPSVAVGTLIGTPVTSGVNVCDGAIHHLAVEFGITAVTLWVDGIAASSAPWTPGATPNGLSVGGAFGPTLLATMTGAISQVAMTTPPLSGTRIAQHAAAGVTGFEDWTSHSRIERLAAYANIAPADLALEAGLATVTPQATSGGSVMAAMMDVATTEGGALFISGDGKLTFQNRQHRVFAATATTAVELATKDVNHDDLTWSGDKDYLINYVEGSRPEGATQVALNQASIDTYEQYPGNVTLLVNNDAAVRAAATWQVATYSTPKPRLSSVTIDLLTIPEVALRERILGLELGSRLTISGFPSQSPVATADLIVEGSTETQSTTAWTLSLNTIPAADFRPWILGDPVYGVLGTTTIPYF